MVGQPGVIAQLARASDLHSEGRGFDSHWLHIIRSGFKTGNRALRLCLWCNREPKNSLIQFLNRIRERKVRNPSNMRQ